MPKPVQGTLDFEKAIVVDMDFTLFDISRRLEKAGGPDHIDYDIFMSDEMQTWDKPYPHAADTLQKKAKDYKIIYLTGRFDTMLPGMAKSLQVFGFPNGLHILRAPKERFMHSEVYKEMKLEELLKQYNIVEFYDDEQKNCEVARNLGIPNVYQVHDQDTYWDVAGWYASCAQAKGHYDKLEWDLKKLEKSRKRISRIRSTPGIDKDLQDTKIARNRAGKYLSWFCKDNFENVTKPYQPSDLRSKANNPYINLEALKKFKKYKKLMIGNIQKSFVKGEEFGFIIRGDKLIYPERRGFIDFLEHKLPYIKMKDRQKDDIIFHTHPLGDNRLSEGDVLLYLKDVGWLDWLQYKWKVKGTENKVRVFYAFLGTCCSKAKIHKWHPCHKSEIPNEYELGIFKITLTRNMVDTLSSHLKKELYGTTDYLYKSKTVEKVYSVKGKFTKEKNPYPEDEIEVGKIWDGLTVKQRISFLKDIDVNWGIKELNMVANSRIWTGIPKHKKKVILFRYSAKNKSIFGNTYHKPLRESERDFKFLPEGEERFYKVTLDRLKKGQHIQYNEMMEFRRIKESVHAGVQITKAEKRAHAEKVFAEELQAKVKEEKEQQKVSPFRILYYKDQGYAAGQVMGNLVRDAEYQVGNLGKVVIRHWIEDYLRRYSVATLGEKYYLENTSKDYQKGFQEGMRVALGRMKPTKIFENLAVLKQIPPDIVMKLKKKFGILGSSLGDGYSSGQYGEAFVTKKGTVVKFTFQRGDAAISKRLIGFKHPNSISFISVNKITDRRMMIEDLYAIEMTKATGRELTTNEQKAFYYASEMITSYKPTPEEARANRGMIIRFAKQMNSLKKALKKWKKTMNLHDLHSGNVKLDGKKLIFYDVFASDDPKDYKDEGIEKVKISNPIRSKAQWRYLKSYLPEMFEMWQKEYPVRFEDLPEKVKNPADVELLLNEARKRGEKDYSQANKFLRKVHHNAPTVISIYPKYQKGLRGRFDPEHNIIGISALYNYKNTKDKTRTIIHEIAEWIEYLETGNKPDRRVSLHGGDVDFQRLRKLVKMSYPNKPQVISEYLSDIKENPAMVNIKNVWDVLTKDERKIMFTESLQIFMDEGAISPSEMAKLSSELFGKGTRFRPQGYNKMVKLFTVKKWDKLPIKMRKFLRKHKSLFKDFVILENPVVLTVPHAYPHVEAGTHLTDWAAEPLANCIYLKLKKLEKSKHANNPWPAITLSEIFVSGLSGAAGAFIALPLYAIQWYIYKQKILPLLVKTEKKMKQMAQNNPTMLVGDVDRTIIDLNRPHADKTKFFASLRRAVKIDDIILDVHSYPATGSRDKTWSNFDVILLNVPGVTDLNLAKVIQSYLKKAGFKVKIEKSHRWNWVQTVSNKKGGRPILIELNEKHIYSGKMSRIADAIVKATLRVM